MSRHRNVRSINYQDECEGYDDVYGHSVEEDYCVSPGTVAQFTYDRNHHDPLASFVSPSNDAIEEKDEDLEEVEDEPSSSLDMSTFRQKLSDLDNAKLNSCLEAMHNIMGESTPEMTMVEAAMKANFDPNVATNFLMDQQEVPKPQRQRRERLKETRSLQAVTPSARVENISKAPAATYPAVIVAGSAKKPPVQVSAVESSHKGEPLQRSIFKEPSQQGTSGEPAVSISKIKSANDFPNFTPRNEFYDFGADENFTPFATPKKDLASDLTGGTPASGLHKSASKAKMDRLDPQKEYERRKEGGKDYLNLVVIGHVDAGKSTLMGHLLYQLGFVNKKTMHKYEQESKKLGKGSFAFAWVLDETEEERSRGVTMDIAQTRFETKSKVITLIDAPGHKDFIPNMITGAAQADVAVLVINATRGEFETGFEMGGQTREHAMLVRSLGVSQLLIAVNKMDTVDWSQERYNEIVRKLGQFLKQTGYKETDLSYIPCSGLAGENLSKLSTESHLSWYKGPTMAEQIDQFRSPDRPIIDKPLRMCVSDVFKGMGAGFAISGTIQAGNIQAGDRVLVIPVGQIAYVKGVTIDDSPVGVGFAGDNAVVTLTGIDIIDVTIGSILCDPLNAIEPTTQFQARIVIFNIDLPITKGFPVVLHYQSLTEQAHITRLVCQLHRNTGDVIKKNPRCLVKNTSAVVELQVDRPVCVELYRNFKDLGRFMLRSGGSTIAAGLVTEIVRSKAISNGNDQ